MHLPSTEPRRSCGVGTRRQAHPCAVAIALGDVVEQQRDLQMAIPGVPYSKHQQEQRSAAWCEVGGWAVGGSPCHRSGDARRRACLQPVVH